MTDVTTAQEDDIIVVVRCRRLYDVGRLVVQHVWRVHESHEALVLHCLVTPPGQRHKHPS